jgi:hypothetical protein
MRQIKHKKCLNQLNLYTMKPKIKLTVLTYAQCWDNFFKISGPLILADFSSCKISGPLIFAGYLVCKINGPITLAVFSSCETTGR